MEIFKLTVNQMLMMFALILTGYFLRKKKILPDNAGTVMSKLETNVFLPALYLRTLLINCTVLNFKEYSPLIFYGFFIILVSVAVAFPLSKLFIKNPDNDDKLDYQRCIYKYALSFGNYGFMGSFIVLSIWGDMGYFKYTMFTMLISVVCHGWGLYVLIPKDKSKSLLKNLIKGIVTPPTIATFAGVVLGLLDVYKFVPPFIDTALKNAGSCMGPVAMLLAGFVVGGYDLKEMIKNKKVYFATLLRLIVLPAIFLLALKFLKVNEEIIIYTLFVLGTPLGLNTIVFPAAYGGDTKTGASMACISHTLSIITLPLMYFVFIVGY